MSVYRKKKIRGFKRHKANIALWKESHLKLDENVLKDRKRDYVKAWIYPFYSLERYQLPNWYKRDIINALVEIYNSWYDTLEKEYEQFYFKIWIFEKDFMRSQVVVAVDEMFDFYTNTFEEVTSISTLPSHLYVDKANQLAWDEAITVSINYENDLNIYHAEGLMSDQDIEKMKADAIREEIYDNNLVYILKDDVVYLGNCK